MQWTLYICALSTICIYTYFFMLQLHKLNSEKKLFKRQALYFKQNKAVSLWNPLKALVKQRHLTTQPLGVVLVGSHCIPPGQTPKNGCIRPHEINIHSWKKLFICKELKWRLKKQMHCYGFWEIHVYWSIFLSNSSALHLHRSLYRQILDHGNGVFLWFTKTQSRMHENHQIFLKDFRELRNLNATAELHMWCTLLWYEV